MRIAVGNGTVAVRVEGTGDPVIALHGGIFVNSLDPLTRLLARDYRVITYDRLGYGESTASPSPYSLEQQTFDLIAVLDGMDVSSAHVVAYSFGGSLALELVVAAPERVRSLVLLEGGPVHLVGASQELVTGLRSLAVLCRTGSARDAIATLLVQNIGPNYRQMLDESFPAGWFERAVNDAATYFEIELPAVGSGYFDAAVARAIATPILSLCGSHTAPAYAQAHDWILEHLSHSSGAVVPGLNHSLQCLSATAVATPVLAFLRSQHTDR